jgi:hypothetical protein
VVAGIKGAVEQGFALDRLAPLYNMTVEQLQQVLQ